MRYILAGINGTVRLDKKSASADLGLATNSLKTCVAVILIGADRISLTHYTPMTDFKAIEKEAEWVGEPFSIVLVKNQLEMDKVIKGNAFFVSAKKEKGLDPDTETNIINFLRTKKWAKKITNRYTSRSGCAYVDPDGKVTTDASADKKTISAPNDGLRSAIEMVNGFYAPAQRLPIKEYDEDVFAPLPNLDAIPAAVLALLSRYFEDTKAAITTDNIMIGLRAADKYLKASGGKNGVQLTIYESAEGVASTSSGTNSLHIALMNWVTLLQEKEKVLKQELADDVFRMKK